MKKKRRRDLVDQFLKANKEGLGWEAWAEVSYLAWSGKSHEEIAEAVYSLRRRKEA